jgi:hypothetical protein
MTREIINTGTGPNSNNGDELRTAFEKTNANFAELYTYVVGSQGVFPVTNANYVLTAPNAGLAQARILTAGYGISTVDAGAGGNLTVKLADRVIPEGTYTNATVTVDSHGHIIDVNMGPGSGYTGSIGQRGYDGSRGAPGYVGSKGYDGSKGADGTSVTILGSVATSTSLPGWPASYVGSVGNGYITLDTNHIWFWNGTSWNDAGNITGPQGYDGSRGPTGYTGSLGYTGSQGVGYTGSIGYTGSQSTAIGYSGSLGYTGSIGIGYTGSFGAVGYTGSQGNTGNIGYTGSVGVGYTGSQTPLTVGTSAILSGTTGRVLYDNAGGLGEYPITGIAGSVVLSTSPTLNGITILQNDAASASSNWSLSQLQIRGADSNQRLTIGYDTTNEQGVIQAGKNGTGWKDLLLNPSGGNVSTGAAFTAGSLNTGGAASITGVVSAGGASFTGNISHSYATNGVSGIYLRNTNAGASAETSLYLGNNSDSQDAQIKLTSSGNTGLGGARSLNFISNVGAFAFLRNYASPTPTLTMDTSGNVFVAAGMTLGSATKSRLAPIHGYSSASSLQTVAVVENESGGAGTSAALGFATAVSGGGETRVAKAAIGLERTTAQGVGDIVLYNRGTADTGSVQASDEIVRFYPSGQIKIKNSIVKNGANIIPWINVKTEYGAVGDGVTNDTTAIQNAYTAAASSGGTLYFPAGTYLMNAQLGVTTAKKIVFRGEGPGLSVLKWSNSSGGISLTFTNMAAPPSFESLSIQTSYSSGGTAITVQAPTGFPGGDFQFGYFGPYFKDLDISGTSTAYWTGGIYVLDAWYTRINDVYVRGSVSDGGVTNGVFSMDFGFKFYNCQIGYLDSCFVLWSNYGLLTTGTVLSEGFNITKSEFVGVNRGIDMTSWPSGATNSISFHDLHINSYQYGIILNRVCNLNISGSYIIKSNISTVNYVGIQMVNGRGNRISNCYIEDGSGATGSFVGILMAIMDTTTINNNVFNNYQAAGTAVVVGTSSNNNIISTNIGGALGAAIKVVEIEPDAGSYNTTLGNRSVSGTAVSNLSGNPQIIL